MRNHDLVLSCIVRGALPKLKVRIKQARGLIEMDFYNRLFFAHVPVLYRRFITGTLVGTGYSELYPFSIQIN